MIRNSHGLLLAFIVALLGVTAHARSQRHMGLNNPHIRARPFRTGDAAVEWGHKIRPGKTTTADDHYNAAVVEYYPVHALPGANTTVAQANNIKGQNVAAYGEFMKSLAGQVDIIVFPEDGIYGAGFDQPEAIAPYLEPIPDVTPGVVINPCSNATLRESAPALANLSCLAREHGVTIVVNMGDKQPCVSGGQCMSTGQRQYNTDVALNEAGDLVAKYHKTHLFYEGQFLPGDGHGVTFTSSFGVTFGIMTCFDVMFAEPANTLFIQDKIRHLIFPTWWVNVPPIMFATGVQRGYSYMRDIAVLAADSGSGWYNSGSGIYQSGRTLATFYNPTSVPKAKVLAASIARNPTPLPRRSERKQAEQVRVVEQSQNGIAASSPGPQTEMIKEFQLVASSAPVTYNANVGDFTCTVTASVNSTFGDMPARYALLACNGQCQSMPLASAQICLVVACPMHPATPCGGNTMLAHASFNELHVSASISPSMSVYPLFAGQEGALPDDSLYKVDGDTMSVLPSAGSEDVLSFGFFARPLNATKTTA